MGRLSVNQRIKKATTPDYRAMLAREWAEEWQDMQTRHLDMLETAWRTNNVQTFNNYIGLLREDSEKRFEALARMFPLVANVTEEEVTAAAQRRKENAKAD